MNYVLRPYQQKAVDVGVRFLKGNYPYNAIEVLPTGSGKSLIISNIVQQLGEPTLIFQPSKEILEQNLSKLVSYGYHASIFSASKNQKKVSDITFATIGSTVNKPELFKGFKYVIVDECHFVNSKAGMYSTFLKQLNAKVLGLTATPYRLVTDSFGGSILKFLTRTRPRVFEELIYYVQNEELFRDGYLAKIQYLSNNGFDRSKLHINSTGADFTDASVRHYYRHSGFQDRIAETIQGQLNYRKNILVFTRFVEEAEYLASSIPGAAIVTAETHKNDREQIIQGFKKGDIKVVCNVGVLTTGFDYPELETIVIARPTMSLALYYQMIGRGIRPHPQKEYTRVIDMCDNFSIFGRVEDLRIVDGKFGKWFIASKGKQLTNVYLDPNWQKWEGKEVWREKKLSQRWGRPNINRRY